MLRRSAVRWAPSPQAWQQGLSPRGLEVLAAKFKSDPPSERYLKQALAMKWQGRRLRRMLRTHTADDADYMRLQSIMNQASERCTFDTIIRLEQETDARIAMDLNANRARIGELTGNWEGYKKRYAKQHNLE